MQLYFWLSTELASTAVLVFSGALASADSRSVNEGHSSRLSEELVQEARRLVENTKRVIVEEMTHMVCWHRNLFALLVEAMARSYVH